MCINGHFSRIRSAWAESSGELDMAAFDAIDDDGLGLELTNTAAEVDYVREVMRSTRGGKQSAKKKEDRQREWYLRHREEIKERNKQYYWKHREAQCARRREYYQKNREAELERSKVRYFSKKHEKQA